MFQLLIYQKLVILILIFFYQIQLRSECLHLNQIEQLDLEAAWQLIMLHTPSLAIAELDVDIKRAEKDQASLKPNPIASVEFENIWGSGRYKGWNESEITYNFWHIIELGDKRRARENLAISQVDIAYWEAEMMKQNLRYILKTAFFKVYQLQEKLKISNKRIDIAESLLKNIDMQSTIKKTSNIPTQQVQLAIKSEQINVKEITSQLVRAKKKLSSMWDSDFYPDFEVVISNFFNPSNVLPLNCLVPSLFNTPNFTQANLQVFTAFQGLKLQKANRIPDLTLRAAYRTHQRTGDYSFIIEVQIPVPIFNQNEGNVKKARLEINQAALKREESIKNLRKKIAIIYDQLTIAYDKIKSIQNGILADAIKVWNLTQEEYQKGKIQYLDLLDAQKTLLKVQEQYIDVLTIYHIKKAKLERWIGQTVNRESTLIGSLKTCNARGKCY